MLSAPKRQSQGVKSAGGRQKNGTCDEENGQGPAQNALPMGYAPPVQIPLSDAHTGLAYVILFKYLPIAGNVIAFKDYKIFKGIWGSPWCGLDNFVRLFQSDNFYQIMGNTLIISFYKILIGFPIPILLALLINEVNSAAFKKTVQTVAYLPHFISWVVIASLASTLLSPNDGAINMVREQMGLNSIFFMGDSRYFRGVLVVSDIWKEMGWSAIIYLAALAGIPLDMYEAATIDGASKLQSSSTSRCHASSPRSSSCCCCAWAASSTRALNRYSRCTILPFTTWRTSSIPTSTAWASCRRSTAFPRR